MNNLKKLFLKNYKFELQWQNRKTIDSFNRPTCKKCGATAVILQVDDGACSDPECCPQSTHIELFCPNLECENISESL